MAAQSGELHRPAPYHLVQPLAGESNQVATQLTQEAAKDVEQCSPYLEHTCDEGHESTVACGLYTLPVVLGDAGKMPRSHTFGIRRFFLQVLQEPPLCLVLWSSLQHINPGVLLSSGSSHPSTVSFHNGSLSFNSARLHWIRGGWSQVRCAGD